METVQKPRRRTLKYIEYYPRPYEIYDRIVYGRGWNYKTNREFYLKRDRAMVALLYLLACRISEVLRLKKSQFIIEDDRVIVRGIRLSKSRTKVCSLCGKKVKKEERKRHLKEEHGIEDANPKDYFKVKRRDQFRQEAWLPLQGKRAKLTELVLEYLKVAPERLFIRDRSQAWKYVTALIGEPPHWLRAYGESYLYDSWDKDLLAVADYVKVDPRTLQHYIRRAYKKYQPA